MCNNATIDGSLAMARRTRSHVIAMICRAEAAVEFSSFSIAVEHDSSGGSVLRIPARKEWPA